MAGGIPRAISGDTPSPGQPRCAWIYCTECLVYQTWPLATKVLSRTFVVTDIVGPLVISTISDQFYAETNSGSYIIIICRLT